jgi:hypothetical protein
MTRLLSETSPDYWAEIMRLDTAHHPRVGRLAAWAGYFVRRTLRNDRSGGTWLVLEGPTGTGKTTVGRFCVRAFNDWSLSAVLAGGAQWGGILKPSAAILNWSRYCSAVERGDSGAWRLQEVLESDVIVLDDVGAESDQYRSGASKAELRDFLESCRNKWLMISTNIPKPNWLEAFGARVADRMDAARRFDTTGIPSYRSKLRGASA